MFRMALSSEVERVGSIHLVELWLSFGSAAAVRTVPLGWGGVPLGCTERSWESVDIPLGYKERSWEGVKLVETAEQEEC